MIPEGIEENKRLVSDFNEAKLQILRLNNSWVLSNNYRRNGKLVNWRWELDTIHDELSSKADKRSDDYRIKIEKIDKEIEEHIDKENLYNLLRKKHRYLKFVQDDIGMGGKMRREDEEDLDE